MNLSPNEFKKVADGCQQIFADWDAAYEKLTQITRSFQKKRDTRRVVRYYFRHKELETRLEELRKFRTQHEQLSTVISRVLKPVGVHSGVRMLNDGGEEAMKQVRPAHSTSSHKEAILQVDLAYDSVKEVDCLDTTKEGAVAWEEAMERYRDQISRIETQLAARLRDQLGGAKNADDMFAIFQRYNALFVRKHIRSAIREYQAKLMDRVREDIVFLQVCLRGIYDVVSRIVSGQVRPRD